MVKPLLGLTGASGFLGRHLAKELSNKYRIRAISHHRFKVKGVSECKVGDLKDPSFLEKAFKGCQGVVHAAAITSATDPFVWEVNVNYTRRLVEAAKRAKVKRFVYISTENVTHHRKDPYTQSKSEAERTVLHQFPQALTLRPSLIFGKEDKRYLGIFVRAIRSLPIVPVFPKSSCTLQPIHVEDVSKFVYQGLKLNYKGIYTLVGTEPRSFAEVGKILARYLGKSRWFVPIPAFLIKFVAFLLRAGPRKLQRLGFMLDNAFILRHSSKGLIEEHFRYKIPPFEERLKDIVDLHR